jgi:putative nucleotidyltransferase with HDIG domain
MPAKRHLLESVSRPPVRVWPDAFVHHGARVLLIVALALIVNLLFPVAPVPDYPQLEIGMVPTEDVLADFAFPIPKSEQQLESERDDAASAVAPLFHYDSAAIDTMQQRIRTFGALLDTASADRATARARITALLQSYGLPSNEAVIAIVDSAPTRHILLQSLESTVRSELSRGIVSSVDAEDSPGPQWRIVRSGSESLVSRDSVFTQADLYELAASHLPSAAPPGLADLQRLLLILFFDGSLRLDRQATEAARKQARAMVPTIKEQVLRGQRIVTAHEPVREDDIERMDAYETYLHDSGALQHGSASHMRALGQFIMSSLLLAIFGLLLLFYRRAMYANFRHVTLIALLVGIVLAAGAIIANADAPVELVPVAFPVLVIAMLWDGRMALILGIVLATLIGTLSPYATLTARLLPLLGGAGAALSVRVVRRRSQGLTLGLFVALAYALATIALGMIRTREIDDIMHRIMWGAVNGVACSLIAMGFLPLFEAYARVTTDQTLLELADLNRPILKRLSLEASGTYAHSINVANLAEAAARAIQANPLLARVGAYYHDIGKIATPQYFIENQARGRNPHEQMDPRHSASLVREHVRDGMRLAEEARLPDSVRAFIPEHHGTQLIGYFYEQARKLNPDATLDPADFAYPGPKPQSKETAILMLADSVESATKTLQDPTPERIREMVGRITQGKIAQGQLDDAPLTLHELHVIQEQLAATLAGIYHHRIDYPAAAVNPLATGAS